MRNKRTADDVDDVAKQNTYSQDNKRRKKIPCYLPPPFLSFFFNRFSVYQNRNNNKKIAMKHIIRQHSIDENRRIGEVTGV